MVEKYISGLLQFFIDTDNLYQFTDDSGRKRQRSLAEIFLESSHLEKREKLRQLKALADLSLYVSGFFGDSLKKKIVDIDYYASVGEQAYGQLAQGLKSNLLSEVYDKFSTQFMTYVDVLTFISRRSFFSANEDLLRIYDTYINTGSQLAKEELISRGVVDLGIKDQKQ